MGCISSKHARSGKSVPPFNSSVPVGDNGGTILDSSLQIHSGIGPLEKIREEPEKEEEEEEPVNRRHGLFASSRSLKKGGSLKRAPFSFRFGRLTESEHVAAGWPSWLSAVAGEVVEGWLPLRSDTFERLEKIGQGTYSNVYRARDVDTGKMVALKKVRFDNFQPESVRFMAREIMILRKLDHPNIMKLEGIITSRLSCSIYLVFEYMEHDLSGLLSYPGIKFTESQIKCYMHQLLRGLEHCHSKGIMHRDIKSSNILVNNHGILKIADFGLANSLTGKSKHPLTSRVVTLWYRPPELLLGSTNYDVTVDLWSVGCVFAELFLGRPLLKGRTEVEQLHKIFKLCGSPPNQYWKLSKLPLATMFKPQHPYESTLRERCREFPKTAVSLIETFLSIEPYKRCSASIALESEYFRTRPHACDPSSLPKYPPNKEIDAKYREEARRKKIGGAAKASGSSRIPRRVRKNPQEPNTFCKVEVEANIPVSRRNGSNHTSRGKGATVSRISVKPLDTVSEASQMTEESQVDSCLTTPIENTASSNFAWAKRQKKIVPPRLSGLRTSRSHRMQTHEPEPPSVLLQAEAILESETREKDQLTSRGFGGIHNRAVQEHKMWHNRLDSFGASELYEPQEFLADYGCQPANVKSGPLLYRRVDSNRETQNRQTIQRSRFSRDPH